MAETLPDFPLFPDPMREGVVEATSEPCSVCHRSRGYVYTSAIYSSKSEADSIRVCPWCIHDGSAAKEGITFNDATIYPCFPDTSQLPPDDAELVEQRTPGFTTWQGNYWLMCCGRACVYRGEVEPGDLASRWASVIPSLFEGQELSEDTQQLILDGLEVEDCASPAAYVFECQVCHRLLGYWDCD